MIHLDLSETLTSFEWYALHARIKWLKTEIVSRGGFSKKVSITKATTNGLPSSPLQFAGSVVLCVFAPKDKCVPGEEYQVHCLLVKSQWKGSRVEYVQNHLRFYTFNFQTSRLLDAWGWGHVGETIVLLWWNSWNAGRHVKGGLYKSELQPSVYFRVHSA